MKPLFLTASMLIALLSLNQPLQAQKHKTKNDPMEKAIITTIENYVQGGDERNVNKLETAFDKHFRAIVNSPGSKDLMVLDHDTYLQMIKGEKIGGDKRTVEIESLDIYNGITANAKVKLTGQQATFYNYYSLAKVNDKWVLVQDLLQMEKH